MNRRQEVGMLVLAKIESRRQLTTVGWLTAVNYGWIGNTERQLTTVGGASFPCVFNQLHPCEKQFSFILGSLLFKLPGCLLGFSKNSEDNFERTFLKFLTQEITLRGYFSIQRDIEGIKKRIHRPIIGSCLYSNLALLSIQEKKILPL